MSVLPLLLFLTAAGLGIGRLAYKNPAVGTAMVTATTVLAFLHTILRG